MLFYAFVNASPLSAIVRAGLMGLLGVGLTLYFFITNNWGVYQVEIAGLTRLGRSLHTFSPLVSGPRLSLKEAGGMLAMLLPLSRGNWKPSPFGMNT